MASFSILLPNLILIVIVAAAPAKYESKTIELTVMVVAARAVVEATVLVSFSLAATPEEVWE